MKSKTKKVPKFKSEDQEREFWDKNDVTDYFDLKSGKRMNFPNLKPSTQTISIRLPEDLLEEIKVLANKRDVPYQSLIKILLRESLDDDSAA
ncbi:MAG TPA: BrnA antitoxin family protein [Bacteriovoracaceae bacterium]|nr:BrnA antitoxin family protein [Bacteriovoracaceae bacterium]